MKSDLSCLLLCLEVYGISFEITAKTDLESDLMFLESSKFSSFENSVDRSEASKIMLFSSCFS